MIVFFFPLFPYHFLSQTYCSIGGKVLFPVWRKSLPPLFLNDTPSDFSLLFLSEVKSSPPFPAQVSPLRFFPNYRLQGPVLSTEIALPFFSFPFHISLSVPFALATPSITIPPFLKCPPPSSSLKKMINFFPPFVTFPSPSFYIRFPTSLFSYYFVAWHFPPFS